MISAVSRRFYPAAGVPHEERNDSKPTLFFSSQGCFNLKHKSHSSLMTLLPTTDCHQ